MFHFVGDYELTSSFLEDELGKLLVLYLGASAATLILWHANICHLPAFWL